MKIDPYSFTFGAYLCGGLILFFTNYLTSSLAYLIIAALMCAYSIGKIKARMDG